MLSHKDRIWLEFATRFWIVNFNMGYDTYVKQ